MTSETLYRPKGAGHSAPGGERRRYVQPRQPLLEAFGEWLDGMGNESHPSFYKNDFYRDRDTRKHLDEETRKAVGKVNLEGVSPAELSSLLLQFPDNENLPWAGMFLTEAYNQMGEDEIVFDNPLDREICLIGYGLKEGKKLYARGNLGGYTGYENSGIMVVGDRDDGGMIPSFFGQFSSGTIVSHMDSFNFGGGTGQYINFASVGNQLEGAPFQDQKDEGAAVNFGNVKKWFGWGSHNMLVNCKGIEGSFGFEAEGIVLAVRGSQTVVSNGTDKPGKLLGLSEEQCAQIPRLVEYFQVMEDVLGPHRPYSEIFAFLDGLDIQRDVRKILVEAGGWKHDD